MKITAYTASVCVFSFVIVYAGLSWLSHAMDLASFH